MATSNFLSPISTGIGKIADLINLGTGNLLPQIWDFFLYTIITPLLVIAFIVLFFWAQYKLIQLYYFIGKTFFNNVVSLIEKISASEKFTKVLATYKNVFKE